MQRRDPRELAFGPEEMERLVALLGEEGAALLEWQTRVRLQTESDFVVNLAIAEEVAAALRAVKSQSDHTWMLREREALRTSDVEVSAIALRTSGILRVLTREPGIWPRGIATYLYATQYLFVVESTVTLAVDKVLYFAAALRSPDDSLTWEGHRSAQLRLSLYEKLRRLDQLGIGFFSEHINRELRNNMAHAHFELSRSGDLLVGKESGGRQRFALADLVDEMDKTVDIVQTAHLVADRVLTENFLRAGSGPDIGNR